MQAKDIKPKATHTKLRMLDLIERGIIIAISRLTVDQVETDHGWSCKRWPSARLTIRHPPSRWSSSISTLTIARP